MDEKQDAADRAAKKIVDPLIRSDRSLPRDMPDMQARFAAIIRSEYEPEIAALRARCEKLEESLTRLRDCDWVISLPDRMDAVREIARDALSAHDAEARERKG